MPNPVVHFEILGKDGSKTKEFYKSLFGWQVQETGPEMGFYGLVDAQDGKGAAGGLGVAMDGQPLVTFYVEVDDPQAYLDKAVSMGATVAQPVMEIPGVTTIAQFRDPDGNLVGITGHNPARG